MAQDNMIPYGKPGVASFESETYGNAAEPLFSDTPPVATKTYKGCTFAGAVDWPLYSLVSVAANGAITLAAYAANESNAVGVLAEPVVMTGAGTMDVAINVAGHYTQQAVNFAASFDTDAKKQQAHKGAPMLLISKRVYTDDGIPA